MKIQFKSRKEKTFWLITVFRVIFALGQLIFALLSLTVNKLKQLVFEKNSCFCSMEDIKEVEWSTSYPSNL